MAQYRYFSHSDPAPPVARSAFQRIADCGHPDNPVLGENIAAGHQTPKEAFDAWIKSAGHRANIERPDYRATVSESRTRLGVSTAGTGPGLQHSRGHRS